MHTTSDIRLGTRTHPNKGRRARRRKDESGVTLLEVLLTLSLVALTMAPLAGFVMVSARLQADAKQRDGDASSLGLAGTYFGRDVENSKAAVSSTTPTGGARPTSDLLDCIGGAGTGGEVRLVLITAANRRIVYSVSDTVGKPGRSLWRRECPNLSTAADPTLNDPTLSAPAALNPGHVDPSTSGNNGTAIEVATGLTSVSTSCPLPTGTGQDSACRSVKMTAVRTSASTVVLQGTRRITSYAPPGTPPIATFTYSMTVTTDGLPPERTRSVSFDASNSVELRGEMMTYSWNFGDGTTATGVTVTHAFARSTAGSGVPYDVVLTVSSTNGSDAETKAITVVPRKPTAVVTTPTPITAVQLFPLTLSGTLGSLDDVDASGVTHTNPIVSASWDWGDGSAPAAAGCSTGVYSCTSTVSHTYTTTGLKTVTLSVTDTLGATTTRLVMVTVRSGYYYASQTTGTDTASCGPLSNPCASIVKALANALANNRTGVRVATGTYGAFSVVNGIAVTGGYSSDFSTQGAPGNTTSIAPSTQSGYFGGILASGVTSPTVLRALTVTAATAPGGVSMAGVAVTGSTALTLDQVTVTGSTGPHATGVLVAGASTVTITASSIDSGATTGAGSSAYGVRAIGGSTVSIDASTVTARAGVAGADGTSVPGAASGGCGGNNGGNASGPSSPGGGGAACGSGRQAGGAGGTGGNYSGGGASGSAGGGGAAGGGGGCGSLFGCGTDAGGGSAGGGGAGGASGAGGAAATAGLAAAGGDLFTGLTGLNGGDGAVGAGGGGGGGGKSASASGGGGGGGGGGANGGTGGIAPGSSGGGSFALYEHNATITVTGASTVTATAGGAGGKGGPGGTGGTGGNGGSGGSKSCCSAGSGGSGGRGGGGGGGGGAGGGPGGPSIAAFGNGTGGITIGGSVTLTRAASGAVGGVGGSGGAGGAGGTGGSAGPTGSTGSTGLVLRSYINGATAS